MRELAALPDEAPRFEREARHSGKRKLPAGRRQTCSAVINLGAANLEVGLVAELEEQPQFLAVSRRKNSGFRNGLLVDPQLLAGNLLASLEECERDAGLRAVNAHLAFASRGFRYVNDRSSQFLGGSIIRESDVAKLIDDCKPTDLPSESRLLSERVINFAIDGYWGAQQLEGLFAHSLSVEMQRQLLDASIVINLDRLFRDLDLPLASIVSSTEASAMALLAQEERELGAIVLDFGEELTGIYILLRDAVEYGGYIKPGGGNITLDIARGLAVSRDEAEQLKIRHADVAISHGADFQDVMPQRELTSADGRIMVKEPIAATDVSNIVASRLKDTLAAVERVLMRHAAKAQCTMLCQLCGGNSMIAGVEQLVEQFFASSSLTRSASPIIRNNVRQATMVRYEERNLPASLLGIALLVQRRAQTRYASAVNLHENWYRRLQQWLRLQV